MTRLVEVEGIADVYAEKLRAAGIPTIEALLKMGASPQSREEIAEKTGISSTLLLRWINHADLFRIKGVASEYSELLEAAGVDTVVELARRVPEHLYQKLLEVNGERRCVRRPPTLNQVKSWVEQAKALPRMITY